MREIVAPPSPGAKSTKISSGRRLWFRMMAIGLAVVVGEAAAWVAYGLLERKPFSFAQVHRQQDLLRFDDDSGRPLAAANAYFGDAVPHPYLGYTYAPNPELGINPYGFVGPSPIQARSTDRLIVGVFGGSVSLAMWSSARAVLEAELGRVERFRGRKIVWVVAAVGGYKQPQTAIALEYLLALGAEFDVVINLDGFNEVALPPLENTPRGLSPIFPRSWDLMTLGMPHSAARQHADTMLEWKARRRQWARLFSRRSFRHSALLCLLWRTGDAWIQEGIADSTERLRNHAPASDLARAAGPPLEAAEPLTLIVETWQRCSRRMADRCRAEGIEYFHFLQPNQYLVGSKPLSADEQRDAIVPTSSFRDSVMSGYPALRHSGERLRAAGVNFSDLSGMFAAVRETVYADGCCHLNDLGYRLLADRVAHRVAEGPIAIPLSQKSTGTMRGIRAN